MIKVTVWNEFSHEKSEESVKKIYPNGIHSCIAEFLGKNDDIKVTTATLDMPECGLTDDVLESTDVLIWWGHMLHGSVPDEIVDKVYNRVMRGMGFIALHSAHHSKIFKKLVGQTANLSWRDNDRERIWNILPSHPVAKGISEYFELEHEEMYGEPFDIPQPDQLIFLGWFAGGEVFRSGCAWYKKNAKIFYFQPGHEAYPTFYDKNVQTVITNAVRWVCPDTIVPELICPNTVSPEELRKTK